MDHDTLHVIGIFMMVVYILLILAFIHLFWCKGEEPFFKKKRKNDHKPN